MDEKILFEAEIKVTDSEFQEKIKESQNNAIALREELKVLNKTYAIMQAKQEGNTEAVVNCFQIIVSLTLLTTIKIFHICSVSCELLSNYCIFDIIDNQLCKVLRILKL